MGIPFQEILIFQNISLSHNGVFVENSILRIAVKAPPCLISWLGPALLVMDLGLKYG